MTHAYRGGFETHEGCCGFETHAGCIAAAIHELMRDLKTLRLMQGAQVRPLSFHLQDGFLSEPMYDFSLRWTPAGVGLPGLLSGERSCAWLVSGKKHQRSGM